MGGSGGLGRMCSLWPAARSAGGAGPFRSPAGGALLGQPPHLPGPGWGLTDCQLPASGSYPIAFDGAMAWSPCPDSSPDAGTATVRATAGLQISIRIRSATSPSKRSASRGERIRSGSSPAGPRRENLFLHAGPRTVRPREVGRSRRPRNLGRAAAKFVANRFTARHDGLASEA